MVKKNFVFNLFYTLLNVLFPVIAFSYVSRILGPSGIGKVQFIISIAQYFALAAALGIPFYGAREVARCKNDQSRLSKLVSEILIIHLTTSLIVFIAFLGVITTSDFFYQDFKGYMITGFFVLLGFSTIDWFYSGIEQFTFIALRSFIIKLLSLIFIFYFVNKTGDYYSYLGILTFSYVGGNVWNIIDVLTKVRLTRRNLEFKKHFKPLIFIFSTSLAISLYQVFDTIILRFLSSETAVGLYTAAVKISKISLPLVISLGTVLIPRISVHLHEKNTTAFKSLVDKSFDFIFIFSLPVCVGIFLLSKELLLVFSGAAFLEASQTMKIVSLLTLVIGLSNLYGFQILTSAQKDKEVFIAVMAGVISSVSINFLLIPRYGHVGAATATIVSEILVTLIAFYFARKYYRVQMNTRTITHSLACVCMFIPIIIITRLYLSSPLSILLVSIPICAVVYFSMQLVLFKNEILSLFYHFLMGKFLKQNKA